MTMSEHHRDASVAVAQALFDGMSSAERAEVQAEADTRGVSAVEIVRRSLDILIAGSRPTAQEGRIVGRSAD